jgi:hypothetical protein
MEILETLGREAAGQIAGSGGRGSTERSLTSVRAHRLALRIPNPFLKRRLGKKGPPWTAQEDKLLGTAPDKVIAARLGRERYAVSRRRRVLGIRRPARVLPSSWKPEEDRLLGTMPDREIAARLGRNELAVVIRRRKLNILKPDHGSRSYTPAEEKLLGTLPDEELARKLGRSASAIATHRSKLGIVKFQRKSALPWSEADLALLGKVPDNEIAARTGRSLEAVKIRRNKLGLATPAPNISPGPRNKSPCSAPNPTRSSRLCSVARRPA